MYEAYWQLTSKPFENYLDPRFYYPSEVHQGALLKLRYAVENARGAALLCGESGCGKTMLLQSLRRQLGGTYTPFVHVFFPQMSSRELLAYLAVELGSIEATSAQLTADESVRVIQDALSRNTTAGRHAVVAVDEAQMLLDADHLETVRLLLNFEATRPPLTLLLVGQTPILPTLDRMPSLEERLVVKCLLRPFTADETAAYISHRLHAAGAKREIFSPDALSALHHLTQGSPRRINRLCDLALLIGYAEEQPRISASQVEAVAQELVTVAPE